MQRPNPQTPCPLSVVIPTYQRGEVLLDTVEQLLACAPAPAEIILVDQTEEHDAHTRNRLAGWHAQGKIRWLTRAHAAIVPAMNHGLRAATSAHVLFLDDDIRLPGDLLGAHLAALENEGIWAVAGQVLQPGQKPDPEPPAWRKDGFSACLDFPFNSAQPAEIANVMAGNLCVRRERALQIGGFDENYLGSAYRFETDFARRLVRAGGRIRFEPRASIDHLRAERGGTRSQGDHLCSASPLHGMGDYYFALMHGRIRDVLKVHVLRPFREVRTRHHLRHPWCIPIKFLGELRAMWLAWQCAWARRP